MDIGSLGLKSENRGGPFYSVTALIGEENRMPVNVQHKFALAMLASMAIALALQIWYTTHIPPGGNPDTDYFIDSYKYMYYGEQVDKTSDVTGGSILALSEDYQPNAQSKGIIYLNALVYRVLPSWYCLPLLFGTIYSALFYLLYRVGHFNTTLLLFPFYSLYLHIYLPSKEAFLFISFILLLIGLVQRRLWFLGLFGFVLMVVVRPEGAAIFVFSLLTWLCMKNRSARYVFLLVGLITYMRFREQIFDFSFLSQTVKLTSNDFSSLMFCRVGPLSVCLDTTATFELIGLQRMLTLVFLPAKWAWNITQVVSGGSLVHELYHRLALILHIVLAAIVVTRNRTSTHSGRRIRKLVAYFAAYYISAYGVILYYQPSREFVVTSCFVLIALTITSDKCNGALEGQTRLSQQVAGKQSP